MLYIYTISVRRIQYAGNGFTSVAEKPLSRAKFVKSMVTGAVEGGLTPREYIKLMESI
jgi:hypothetical protein